MLRRYFAVLGAVVVVVVGLAIWLKPPLEKMREGVQAGLTAYAEQHVKPGGELPEVRAIESHDWGVAVSHIARLGDDLTFSCIGAFKVTVCNWPD
jgi:hypothetical protein